MSAESQKQAVGEAAAELVDDGMVVGLGTGTTAAFFVRALASRRLHLRCVATSVATAGLARELGLTVIDLDACGAIDLTVDGADELTPDLALIKGGGAALLHEKLVWMASRRCVVIADAGKQSPKLGRFLLPIEVIRFGQTGTCVRIAAALKENGIQAEPLLRRREGNPVITDSGNVIYDVACGVIVDPTALARSLKGLTGVVEHGLFLGLAQEALIGSDDGVQTLHP